MRRESKSRKICRAAMLLCLLASPGLYAAEHGAVTQIAGVDAQSSAFVGFASGAVLLCSRLSGCMELDGTPNYPVTSLAAQSDGKTVKAWVGYENGTVYFCTLTGGCILQDLTPNPGKSKHPL